MILEMIGPKGINLKPQFICGFFFIIGTINSNFFQKELNLQIFILKRTKHE